VMSLKWRMYACTCNVCIGVCAWVSQGVYNESPDRKDLKLGAVYFEVPSVLLKKEREN